MSEAVIAVEGLTKRFGSSLAVDDVSFEVQAGQIVGFLGHNGAGKTTTLRMLLGQIRPDAGSATIFGVPYTRLDHPLRSIGVQFESGVHPGRTGRNHLRVSAAIGGLRTDRIGELLRLVDLEDAADRRVGGYSQGMRQRLGLATALLADPEILILDEPGNGLDPEGIRWLRSLLRGLAERGCTILLSSHQLGEVAQTVDRVVVIDRGAVVAESPLDELVRRAGTEVLVRSPGAEVLAQELQRAGIATRGVSAQELRARDAPPGLVSELATRAGLPVWEVSAIEPSLEEVFFELTHGHRDANGSSDPGDGHPARDDDTDDDAAEAEAADQAATALADAEARVDRGLADQPPLDRGRVVAVVAPGEKLGRTTLSFLIGDVLAGQLGLHALAIALSCDRERMCMPVPSEDRSSLSLPDLLGDLPDFDEVARMSPYVSAAPSGLHTLCGPRRAADLETLSAQQINDLLDFAARFYTVIVLDVGEVGPACLEAILRRADEVVVVSAPDAGDVPAESTVLEAVEAHRTDRATLVVNRVDEQPALAFAEHSPRAPHALVPHDRDLVRALDAGDFRLERVQPATRVALKRLGLVVAEGLR